MALKKKGTPEKLEIVVTAADLDRWAKIMITATEPPKEEKKAKKSKRCTCVDLVSKCASKLCINK